MSRWEWQRLGPASGVIFVALVGTSSLLLSLPDYNNSNQALAAYFRNHHRVGVAVTILAGIASIAFLVLLSSLATALRVHGQRHLAAIIFGSGLVALAIGAVNTIILTSLTFRIARDAPHQVKGLYDLRAATSTLLAFPLAALMAATALAMRRGRLRPVWYTLVSLAAALITIGKGVTLTRSGFFSSGSSYGQITSITVLFWTLATSLTLAIGGPAGDSELDDS